MRTLVDTALKLPRAASTARSARRFARSAGTPHRTDDQSQYNMRATMDLDPRMGKWMARLTPAPTDASAWQLADIHSSRFVDASEVDAAVEGIRRDGFYVFRSVVPAGITSAILSLAEQAPAIARGAGNPPSPYPRSAPTVGRYDLTEETALQCPEVQEFATDPGMALVSQRYLRRPVLMDEVAFWWTTTQRSEDANLNAQLFHQDRDRLSFLKFFMYLTDVTSETGPHVYIRGSHRRIPWALRGDGRKTDEAVRRAGLWSDVTELTGPAGTLMAVDTIGLHKGKTPVSGDRLALETEFATSLFGADYELPAFTPTDLTRVRVAQMPFVLQRYAGAVG